MCDGDAAVPSLSPPFPNLVGNGGDSATVFGGVHI